jgi:hypothetical protein
VGNETFALWGAGQLAMKILSRPGFPGAQLAFVVDAAPTRQGQKLGTHEVFAPAAIPAEAWPRKVVAGSVFAEASIERSALSLGIDLDVIELTPRG